MCDGTYQYPTKGGNAIKLDSPLILICGNASIETVYPKAHKFIQARFIETCLDTKGTLPVTVLAPSPKKTRDMEPKDIMDIQKLQEN